VIVEHLMYACQGLSEPYIEYWGKDSDEKDYPDEYHSRVLELSEINKLIDERVKHPILPQTTRQKLIDSSVEYFGGEGVELPYAVKTDNGMRSKKRMVSSSNIIKEKC
jgi:hypothetical protein